MSQATTPVVGALQFPGRWDASRCPVIHLERTHRLAPGGYLWVMEDRAPVTGPPRAADDTLVFKDGSPEASAFTRTDPFVGRKGCSRQS